MYEVYNADSKPWNYRLMPSFCLNYPYKMTPSGTIYRYTFYDVAKYAVIVNTGI